MRGRRAGFSLVEALIALVLSSIVMILVSTTFLVQNRLQARQATRVRIHEDVRASTELVAREIRSAMGGGIVVAGNRTLTVRSPVAVGSVCNRVGAVGAIVDLHLDRGLLELDADEVAGVALHDPVTGAWDYRNETWTALNAGSVQSANRCADNGADTLSASGDFHSVRRLHVLFGPNLTPEIGELVMLFRETTFSIRDSALEPGSLGLFREPRGGNPVEFSSGIDTTTVFRYRVGPGVYQDTVSAGSVDGIDAVQIVIEARRRSETAGDEDVTFGWATTVSLRNAP